MIYLCNYDIFHGWPTLLMVTCNYWEHIPSLILLPIFRGKVSGDIYFMFPVTFYHSWLTDP